MNRGDELKDDLPRSANNQKLKWERCLRGRRRRRCLTMPKSSKVSWPSGSWWSNCELEWCTSARVHCTRRVCVKRLDEARRRHCYFVLLSRLFPCYRCSTGATLVSGGVLPGRRALDSTHLIRHLLPSQKCRDPMISARNGPPKIRLLPHVRRIYVFFFRRIYVQASSVVTKNASQKSSSNAHRFINWTLNVQP